MNSPFKVALVSSGLGHITRGVETWTEETAYALKDEGVRVALYKGGGRRKSEIETVLPCISSRSAAAKFLRRHAPPFAWHVGLGTETQIEQVSFSFALLANLVRHPVEVIHTQEAHLADMLRLAKKLGIIRSKLILAHGTNEPLEFLKKFECVQNLTPIWAERHRVPGRKSFMIPNFVDTGRFRPGVATDLRRTLGIPEDAFVILSVAAINKLPKGIHCLVSEVSRLVSSTDRNIYLLVAGGETPETTELTRMAEGLLGRRAFFLINYPVARMPSVYAAADIFALCSIREMCSVAIMEALASGLPVISSDFPSIKWQIGPGGDCLEIRKEGELSGAIPKYFDPQVRAGVSQKAREWAIATFDKKRVIGQYIRMYREILGLE